MKTEKRPNALRGLQKARKEIRDKELDAVNGGNFAIRSDLRAPVCKHIHSNCGGEILNVGNLFASCRCSRCGLKHYWLYSFDYTTEYEDK